MVSLWILKIILKHRRIGNKFSKTVSLVLNDGVGYIIEILKSLFS